MKKTKRPAKLADTLSIKGRSEEADALEKQRLEIAKELEALMAEYAAATGKKHLKGGKK